MHNRLSSRITQTIVVYLKEHIYVILKKFQAIFFTHVCEKISFELYLGHRRVIDSQNMF